MYNILCVLRSGGQYNERHVEMLFDFCNANMEVDFKFYCLTDIKKENFPNWINIIPLKTDLPGWWAKLEIFRDDLNIEGKKLYLDLDTVIVDRIDDSFFRNEPIVLLEDVYKKGTPASGIISWNGDFSFLFYNVFEWLTCKGFTKDKWKKLWDQRYIQYQLEQLKIKWEYFDVLCPKKAISYKEIVKKNKDRIPEGTKIVFFHGSPKPWELTDHYIVEFKNRCLCV